jgi:hypothetical protein
VPLSADKSDAFYARVEYWLLVTITSKFVVFGRKIGTTAKKITIPFTYIPRSRSASAPLGLSFYSSLKANPDGWFQVYSQMQLKERTLGSLHFDLFMSTVHDLPLNDPMQLHLHISGDISIIKEFHRVVSSARRLGASNAPTLRVFVLRQLVAEPKRGQHGKHEIILAEGQLTPVPPTIDWISYPKGFTGLEWEVKLRWNREDHDIYGSFNSSYLRTKDSLVVAFQPGKFPDMQLLEHEFCHPLNLVTDGWVRTTMF